MNALSDPDFSTEVVNDLYRYQGKKLWVAVLLAVFLGLLGAHRFYLRRPLTGLCMLLSLGGVLIWWIRDLFVLREMLRQCNAQEQERIASGLPPRGMDFLPPQRDLRLDQPPAWASRRAGKSHLVGSALMLTVTGFSLGAVTGASGLYEPAIILAIFTLASLLAARWSFMLHIPVLRSLSRWVHRLRLYYHTVDPGSLWRLAMRPIFGVFIAPWRTRARAEVKLYLQFGVLLALAFYIGDLAELLKSSGIWAGLGLLVTEFAQTLLFTYLFVAPVGALLTTQLLLAKHDGVVWTLSGLTAYATYVGLRVVS
ncbi:MAG: hypothetical protein Cons2KO_10810 [Congregibacter sp.]